jgi:HAE1 family hydrophobic/amphiphilic exporter-1
VIDDAIVVRENTLRHMERGETPFRAASRATAQIATSVLAMTLTIVAVFLPVVFTSGITGIIFKSFGLTVASAMVISLFEAFMISPMLSAYLFKQQKPKQNHEPPKGYWAAGSTENPEPSLVSGQVSVATTDEQQTTNEGQRTAEEELLDEANEPLNALGRSYERLLAWSLRHGQSSQETKARLRPQLAFLPDMAFGQPSILGFVQFGVETRGCS